MRGRFLLGLMMMAVVAGTACVPATSSISGTVSFDTGLGTIGAGGIEIRLAPAVPIPNRPLIRQATTDALGNYRFENLEAGCYLMVFEEPTGASAPDAAIGDFPNTRPVCLGEGEVADGPDLILVADDRMASLGGQVTSLSTGAGEGLVLLNVYTADLNGNRVDFVGDTISGPDGRFTFAVIPACYRLVFQAPANRSFPNGTPPNGEFFETTSCVGAGQKLTNINPLLN